MGILYGLICLKNNRINLWIRRKTVKLIKVVVSIGSLNALFAVLNNKVVLLMVLSELKTRGNNNL